jgi:hypothetical protein
VTIPGNQNENGPLTGGTDPVKKIISKFQTPLKFANSKRKPSLTIKILKLS